LGIANVLEGGAEETCGLGVAEGGGKLSLGGRGNNNRYAGGEEFDGGIGERGVVITEGMVAPSF
jgi:hypothetical protein